MRALLLFLTLLSLCFADSPADNTDITKVVTKEKATNIFSIIKRVDKKHSYEFMKILIQNVDGRVHPLHTTAINVLNKIHGKSSFLELDAPQVFLGMLVKSSLYKRIKMIKVKNADIKRLLGVSQSIDYISFNDAFDFSKEIISVLKPLKTSSILQ